MEKALHKVTKNLKRQERGKKIYKTYIKRLKENILRDNHLSTFSFADNSTSSTSSSMDTYTPYTSFSTNNFTPSSSDT